MALSDAELKSYEKVTQRYYKEFFDYAWGMLGLVASLIATVSGIYFSQVAFAEFLGNTEMMIVFSYGISVLISTLEVGGVKLLGNKSRSRDIASENALEHTIMTWFTWALFVFDIASNVYGLYITVAAHRAALSLEIGLVGWIFIILLSALMGAGEIFVGWALRHLAVAKAQYVDAKDVYDRLTQKIENSNPDNNRKYASDIENTVERKPSNDKRVQ